MKVINYLDNELMRTGTEPNMGKQEGNTGRRQNMSPTVCDNGFADLVWFWCLSVRFQKLCGK